MKLSEWYLRAQRNQNNMVVFHCWRYTCRSFYEVLISSDVGLDQTPPMHFFNWAHLSSCYVSGKKNSRFRPPPLDYKGSVVRVKSVNILREKEGYTTNYCVEWWIITLSGKFVVTSFITNIVQIHNTNIQFTFNVKEPFYNNISTL